jgi:hypothetical protein
MDAGYNLAQALSDLAVMLDDLTLEDEAELRIRDLRIEARRILESVFEGQEEYLRLTVESRDENVVEDEIDHAANGGEGGDMELDTKGEAGDGDAGDEQETFQTHLPTPSTLLDTTLLLLDIHLSLWATQSPPQTPSVEQQTVVRSLLDCTAPHVPPGRQAELDLAEIKILLTMDDIVWDIFKGEARVGTGVETSLEGAITALDALLASLDVLQPDEPTLKAEIITTLAETHTIIANRQLFLTPQLPPGPSPLAQGAWYHLTQSTTLLANALGSGAPPGSPKTFGPSIFLNLSKASLRRASLGSVNDAAKRNGKQLLDNAITYGNRAASGLGWNFATIDFAAQGDIAVDLPWQSGWDAEALARMVPLQLLRVCWYSQSLDIDESEKVRYSGAGRALVTRLNRLDARRKLVAGDVERFIAEIEDAEQGMTVDEKAWWSSVTLELNQ